MDVGDVITVRVPNDRPRRYLVTAKRPAGRESDELTLLIDPDDDDGRTVRYRAFR